MVRDLKAVESGKRSKRKDGTGVADLCMIISVMRFGPFYVLGAFLYIYDFIYIW